jgi:23S rRNA (adenine2503-C2)-methyltransferase
MLPALTGQSPESLAAWLKAAGEPSFRAAQILEWIWKKKVTSYDAMTNLPAALRAKLTDSFRLTALEHSTTQGSADTTRKFLFRLHDGRYVESVLIPANPALYGEASDRHTLCVSTQVGCAYGCKFCASGLDGWKRNLGPEEIVEQVLATERWHVSESVQCSVSSIQSEGADAASPSLNAPKARLINNLVIMGMGEPLANYDNLLKALRLLNAPWGGGIGARKITISTSGLAPQIRKLAVEPEQFRLAISLHGATDEVRARIMPVNRKYPLAELVAALEVYQRRKDQLITFEYILIAGVNDGLDQVKPLAALATQLHAKVNLIPYNTVEGLEWSRPAESVCEAFLVALERHEVTATLRREKGGDIDAACGQLRLKTERELSNVP